MVDIIERNNPSKTKFNMRSIYNANGVTTEDKLEPFTSKIMQLKTLQRKIDAKERWEMPKPLVTWWVNSNKPGP
jgi:hypothetical protein